MNYEYLKLVRVFGMKIWFKYFCTKPIHCSRPKVFCKKGVLKNFSKFTGKHLCQSLRPATLLKKRLWHRYFPVNFAKFVRTPFLQNSSGRLLLLRPWENDFVFSGSARIYFYHTVLGFFLIKSAFHVSFVNFHLQTFLATFHLILLHFSY